MPPIEEALAYEYNPAEWAYLSKMKESYIDGTPEYVREKVEELADSYATDDVGIVTICYDSRPGAVVWSWGGGGGLGWRELAWMVSLFDKLRTGMDRK